MLLIGAASHCYKEYLIEKNTATSNKRLNFDFPNWANREEQRAGWILQEKIKSFFIGHAHLDHLSGFALNMNANLYKGMILTSPCGYG